MGESSPTVARKSLAAQSWHRYKKSKLAMLGLALMIFIALVAIFAGVLADYETQAVDQNMSQKLLRPGPGHWFGTDQYGRDLYARVIHGARYSLSAAVACTLLSLVGGIFIGAQAGYYGGLVDNALMRVMDIFFAIPALLMAIAIVSALGVGLVNLVLAMTISNIPQFARIVRAAVMTIKGEEFVEAARACGSNNLRILRKHILPNVIGPIIVQATLSVGRILLMMSSLSFIGLGAEKPMPEWGALLADGKEQMRYYPYLIIIPGIAIILTVMAFNLVGDGLRDALDPKQKK